MFKEGDAADLVYFVFSGEFEIRKECIDHKK